jgi:hypothetical protein
MKINVDAAVKKTCKSGAIAAVCRAMNRDFLGASSVVVHGIGDPAALTAMACREALALAADLNIQKMGIASDHCLEVTNSFKGDYFGIFISVINKIKFGSCEFAEVEFVHERRTSNMKTHGLAQSSVSHGTSRHGWLLQTPNEICIPMSLTF